MKDNCGREINYMRISVTDKCNLKCRFCMPDGGIKFLAEEKILSFDEIKEIIKSVIPLGICNFKITGGEPLIRKGITKFIADIKSMDKVNSVTLTTNGILLRHMAKELAQSKIDGINVSLTSLDPKEYEFVTGSNKLNSVLEGINKALEYGIDTKINCLPLININEDNIEKVAVLAKNSKLDVRFIEMMPIGRGASFETISNEVIKKRLENKYGVSLPCVSIKGNGPAVYYKFPEFSGNIGFISAKSHSFCSKCNRVRLTADGYLKLCLNYDYGISLKELIRQGISREQLTEKIKEEIYKKPKHHSFNESNINESNINTRFMAQIGG